MTKERRRRVAKRTINFALQGEGSHGAFACSVLDKLLEAPEIAVEGVVGTSAGAMNAAVAAYGLTIGGNAGARSKLAEFWRSISERAQRSSQQPS